MNARLTLAVGLVLLVGSLLVYVPGGSSRAQEAALDPAALKPTPNRFRMEVGKFGGSDAIVVCDTTTGQCWVKTHASKRWGDHGSPSMPLAEK